MTKTWCVGGKHYSSTSNMFQYEKVNPKTKNWLKLSKVIVVSPDETKVRFLLSK